PLQAVVPFLVASACGQLLCSSGGQGYPLSGATAELLVHSSVEPSVFNRRPDAEAFEGSRILLSGRSNFAGQGSQTEMAARVVFENPSSRGAELGAGLAQGMNWGGSGVSLQGNTSCRRSRGSGNPERCLKDAACPQDCWIPAFARMT